MKKLVILLMLISVFVTACGPGDELVNSGEDDSKKEENNDNLNTGENDNKKEGYDENLNPVGFVPPSDYKGVYLALSVNWAEYNVGAENINDCGGCYGWGDATGGYYLEDPNKYPSVNPPMNISGTQYDIVTQKWGNGWRMPTMAEMQELIDKCRISWDSSMQAWKVEGNKNVIYLPFSPIRTGQVYHDDCGYWTATLNKDNNTAYCLFKAQGGGELNTINSLARYYGLAVRPVKDIDTGLDYKNLAYSIDGKTFKTVLVEGENIQPFYIMQTELPPNSIMQVGDKYVGVLDGFGSGADDDVIIKSEFTDFLKYLREVTGIAFRLPTKEEWQYAAKGGSKSKGYMYGGSNSVEEVGWYAGNSNGGANEVATKMPNELGLYDMCGNYAEVCYDYNENSEWAVDGPICGGCWNDSSSNCTVLSWKEGSVGANKIPGTQLKELNAFDAKYNTIRLVYSVPINK